MFWAHSSQGYQTYDKSQTNQQTNALHLVKEFIQLVQWWKLGKYYG